ncbi:MAG TPA: BPSS1780 family membrane protein [Rhodanobacteraceae bacterium]|nr:BPSS1780 family membrane protein [Rhodanobacteraceae bacterium]
MTFGKVDAGSGMRWLTEAIGIVFRNPAVFLVMGLILAVIDFVPVLGGLVLLIAGPALFGGIVFAAREESEGRKAEIAHLFRAFQEPGKIGPMLLLCLPSIVGGAVLLVFAFVFGIGALIGGGLAAAGSGHGFGAGALGGGVLVLCLVALAVSLAIYALQFFAVPRVMLAGAEPFAAMKESFDACIANLGAFLVFGVVFFVAFAVLSIVLMLVPLLGWLALFTVASPAFACGQLLAWREVFGGAATAVAAPTPPPPPPA